MYFSIDFVRTGRYVGFMTTAELETKNILLQAAFQEVTKKGFQAASLSSILEDTGLTKGALYHHYKNKKALGLAVVTDVVFAEIRRNWVIPLNQAADPIGALEGIIDGLINNPCESRLKHGCLLNNLIQEMGDLDEDFRKVLFEGAFEWMNAVESALLRGQKNGTVKRDVQPENVAKFIFATIEGATTIGKSFQCKVAVGSVLTELKSYIKGLSLVRY